MAEFDLVAFTSRLKEWFLGSALFPYYEIGKGMETDYAQYQATKSSARSKHPNRNPTHLRDVARQCLDITTTMTDNMITFDYGNAVMESNYPHYHILENTQVIRKRGKGTLKSKGSEDMYKIKAQRDYERVIWNGKTFTKEYRKNVRGIRSRVDKVSHWGIVDGQGKWLNKDSNSYLNVHYHYIEDILDNDVVYRLASEFGLKSMRKVDSGLEEDFADQEGVDIESVLETFASFE